MKIEVHKTDDRGNVITLMETLRVCFREKKFVVPKRFESDGVSTPKFLWGIISPAIDPRTLRAGITHDYIYRTQPNGWSRAEADLMFLCYLIEDGLSLRKALWAYIGVRYLGGSRAWKNNTKMKLEAVSDC